VILLAGTFEPFDEQEARDCGADGHIVKPFESRALREKVEALLNPEPEPAAAPSEPGPEELDGVLTELSSHGAEAASAEGTQAPASGGSAAPAAPIDPALVDAVAREVVKRLSEIVIREIAWEVVPKLATELVRERIRELEADEANETDRE
jgi:DNA-binding response OmpR family regulator